jgi:uncharacterized protein (DUF2235 family)
MARNIVIFSDGTGQDGGSERNTNVYRLFNMTEQRTDAQICYYDPGVGSTGWLSRVPGLASGRGFGRNVRDCYTFIFENFKAGDRLFLIGFSRGAATMRSLASFIHLFGIMPRSRRRMVEQAWRIYTIRDRERRRAAARAFLGYHHTMWTKVHFLGCYDTVAALGLPYNWASRVLDRVPGMKHRFHDFRLSPAVVHAYQALALDDRRTTFHPILWDAIEEETLDPSGTNRGVEPLACEIMRQVWFAGAHSDVGGGYPEKGLSDIPLVWLTRAAVEHGLRIYPRHTVIIQEDPDDVLHDPRAGLLARLYRASDRRWDPDRPDRPVVHESALRRRKSVRNADEPPYAPWIARLPNVEVEPWAPHDPAQGFAPEVAASAEARPTAAETEPAAAEAGPAAQPAGGDLGPNASAVARGLEPPTSGTRHP